MTECTSSSSPERKTGCVAMIYGSIFRGRKLWPRRSNSGNSLNVANNQNVNRTSSSNSKRRRGGGHSSDETAFLDVSNNISESQMRSPERPVVNAAYRNPAISPSPYQCQDQGSNFRASNGPPKLVQTTTATTTTSTTHGFVNQGKKVPQEAIGLSGELDSMINDYQRTKGSSNLVRASSGNVMLYSQFGNLRQQGNVGNLNPTNYTSTTDNVFDYLPKTAKETSYGNGNANTNTNTNYNDVGGRVGGKVNEKVTNKPRPQPESLCRALSTRMDPEQLKIMGNEDYKEGRFAEALALYEAAIAIDSGKASYRSNKSAALTGLGRLLEAVFECREAIRIDPFYHRAHHRLASLYLRLGEAEKALYHYKQSGPETDPQEAAHAKGLQTHLHKCTEAKRLRDWNGLIKAAEKAISCGADSAPQIFALQAEALLKLHRHQEADAIMSNIGPNFSVEDCTKFFGPIGNANLLVIRAQVDLAAGRFEDAVALAQRASRLDSNNKEAMKLVRRTEGVSSARSVGNELFKTSKFLEACTAYGAGLEHDPLNSVLLCNRAACRAKLGQFDKAIEDCTKALSVRPSYTKARLRRADCNAKLERWEASIEDYEVLREALPEDEEVISALSEVRALLKKKKHKSKDSEDMKSCNLNVIADDEHFRQVKESHGVSVVAFCGKASDKQALQVMERFQKKYPKINFLKLEVQDHEELAQSEGVTVPPVFKIYKGGSTVEDFRGNDHESLESTIKFYSS
ncbi:hypothetical protein Syun_013625 [Stephania yunnanensis]|uniref:Thioredoxin domain-containing protein n=1 Tax=Stephania yunnanensis TaxID=152371 RepID=A0AAP0JJU1_9MAGN